MGTDHVFILHIPPAIPDKTDSLDRQKTGMSVIATLDKTWSVPYFTLCPLFYYSCINSG